MATVAATLTAAGVVTPAYAYDGHGSPFSGINTPNYPVLGVTAADVYDKGSLVGSGYDGGSMDVNLSPFNINREFFNTQVKSVTEGDIPADDIISLSSILPGAGIGDYGKFFVTYGMQHGDDGVLTEGMDSAYKYEDITGSGEAHNAFFKSLVRASGTDTLYTYDTNTVEIPLKDLTCDLSGINSNAPQPYQWVNWKEFDTGEAIALNDCLWLMEDGEEKTKRLKTLQLSQSMLRGLKDGTATVEDVKKRLADNGFASQDKLDNLVAQAVAEATLDSTGVVAGKGKGEPGSVRWAGGPSSSGSGRSDRHLNSTEDFLIMLAREAAAKGLDQVVMPIPLEDGDRSNPMFTSASDRSALRRISLNAYYELFTGVRSYDDHPEAAAYLDSLGISWRSGEYVGNPTEKDAYASVLAFIGDQALRSTAKFNSATGTMHRESDNGDEAYRIAANGIEMTDTLMDAYEAFANSATALPQCSAEEMSESLGEAKAVFDQNTAEAFGIQPVDEGPVPPPGEVDAAMHVDERYKYSAYVKDVNFPEFNAIGGCEPTTSTTETEPETPPEESVTTTPEEPTPTTPVSTTPATTTFTTTPSKTTPTTPGTTGRVSRTPSTTPSSSSKTTAPKTTPPTEPETTTPSIPSETTTFSIPPAPGGSTEPSVAKWSGSVQSGFDNGSKARTAGLARVPGGSSQSGVTSLAGPVVDTGGHVDQGGFLDRVREWFVNMVS